MTPDGRARGEALLTGAVAAYESGNLDRCLSMSVEAEELFTQLGDTRLVLAARQRQAMVWATNGDLGIGSQDQVVSSCLSRLYQTLPTALSPTTALAAILRDPSLRQRRLYRWAALAIIGTH